MSTLYNEYLTGEDREIAIVYAEYEAQMAKLDVLLEAVDATLNANMLAAEAKVFAENGTYDDLTMLYTEAQAEAGKNKVGILQSIFNAIVSFFKGIKEKLTGKPVATPDATVEIDGETGGKLNLFQQSWANIQSGINKINSAGFFAGAGDLLKGLGPWVGSGAVVGTATVVTMKHSAIQAKIDELAKNNDKVLAIKNTVDGFLNMFKNNTAATTNTQTDDKAKSEGASEGSDSEKLSLGQKVINTVKRFTNWIADLMKKLKAYITGAASKENTPAEEQPKAEDKKDDAAEEGAESENKYVTKTKSLNKDEKKAAHEDAKKESGKKHLSKEEKKVAEDKAAEAKTKASNDRVKSVISKWDEDEFNESAMNNDEFNHAMHMAIINTIEDKELALSLIEESMLDEENESDDMFTEGAHRDLAKQHHQDLKEFKRKVREIKKCIRKKDYSAAKSLISSTSNIIKSGKSTAMRYIKSVDEFDLASTALGQIFNIICRFCRNILLILFVCPVGAVKELIEEIQDIINMIQKIINKLRDGEKLNVKDFDTYFVHVEKSYDRMASVLDRLATKAKAMQKEEDSDVKESVSSVEDVIDSDDLITESDMSKEDYDELCALFADL